MTKIDKIVEKLREMGIPATAAIICAILVLIFAVTFALCAVGALPPEVDDKVAEIIFKLTNGAIDFRDLAKNTTNSTTNPTPAPIASVTPPTPTPPPTATPTETTPVETPKPTEAPTEPTEAPSAAETATPTVNETTPTATPTVNTTVTEPESSVVPSFPNATEPPLVPTTIYPVKLC